jgi:hypothetical protein
MGDLMAQPEAPMFIVENPLLFIPRPFKNSALTFEALTQHRKTKRKTLEDAIELAESNSSSHASNASGIFRAHSELMKYINGTYLQEHMVENNNYFNKWTTRVLSHINETCKRGTLRSFVTGF